MTRIEVGIIGILFAIMFGGLYRSHTLRTSLIVDSIAMAETKWINEVPPDFSTHRERYIQALHQKCPEYAILHCSAMADKSLQIKHNVLAYQTIGLQVRYDDIYDKWFSYR